MKAVILAGGKGTRLRPYTIALPKPLMPVGDMPILEIIVRQLKLNGIEEVILAVGHLAELIMAYFGDGSRFGVRIRYSREREPLGTAGPLSLLRDDLKDTFLVMNGDILTTLSYRKLVEYHKKSGAVATIALKRRDVYIDFGVVKLNEMSEIVDYVEKPVLNYLVSMGVYVFEPKVLDYIPDGKKFDFPDLVKRLIEAGEKVKGYVYDGYWLDIGRPEDYERANAEIDKIYSELFRVD